MSVSYVNPALYVQGAKQSLSPNEYAMLHNVSIRTVYRWIKEEQLEAKKVGRQWRIDADALPTER